MDSIEIAAASKAKLDKSKIWRDPGCLVTLENIPGLSYIMFANNSALPPQKMKYSLFVLFCLGLIIWGCSPEVSDPNTDVPDQRISAKIDSTAKAFLSEKKVMGFSIAVFRDQTFLYNQSFGKADTLGTKDVQNETFFNLGSISKCIGATVAMKIVEEGKLNLDQTLEELLPEFPKKAQAGKIKFRHLISMTSGLKDYAPAFDSVFVRTGIPPTKQDFFDFFSNQEPDYEPGTFYRYSNSGFVLLPMILERVTGEYFDNLIDRVINQPTGLNIRHILQRQKDPEMTQLFELKDGEIQYRPYWTWFRGDGGLTASSADLVRFPEALKYGRIISKSSFEQMIAPTLLPDDIYSGYGLGVKSGSFEGEELWGHSGADRTYWSMMYHFPGKNITIVTLVNTNNTPSDAKELFNQVALIVLDKPAPDYREDEILNYDKTAFTGIYQRPGDPEDAIVRIVSNQQDQHLYYESTGVQPGGEKMYYLGNGEFWIEKWPTDRVIFVKGANGTIVALKEYYAGYFSQLRKKIK